MPNSFFFDYQIFIGKPFGLILGIFWFVYFCYLCHLSKTVCHEEVLAKKSVCQMERPFAER